MTGKLAAALIVALAAGCNRPAPPGVVPLAAPPRAPERAAAPPLEVVPAEPESGESGECATARAKIRLASPATARRAGIEAATVTARHLPHSVIANATVARDERRVARLASRVPGVVREARKLAGDEVEEGEVLAVVESGELGEAKAALRQAAALVEVREKSWAIERELAAPRAAIPRETVAAEAALAAAKIDRERARQRLRIFGAAEDALAKVERGEDVEATLPVRAPLAGTILERSVALGEAVDASRTLFVVADLTRLVVALDILERDFPAVEVGARCLFTPDGSPGEVFRGKVISRGAELDPATRTIRALAEVRNTPRDGKRVLAPGMFGRAEVVVREGAEQTHVVPREAVQWEGCHFVVFVEVREGFYQTRAVEPGVEAGQVREIRSGLVAGERVATTGSFLLKTEILKGSIGAGCCE